MTAGLAALIAVLGVAIAGASPQAVTKERTLTVQNDGVGAPIVPSASGEAPKPQLVDKGQCTLFAQGVTDPGRVTLVRVDSEGVETRLTHVDVGENRMLRGLVADVPAPSSSVHYRLRWSGMDDTTTVVIIDDVIVYNNSSQPCRF